MDRTESECSKFNDKIMQTGGIDLEQMASAIINPPTLPQPATSPATQKQINQKPDNLIENFVSQLFVFVMNENHYQVEEISKWFIPIIVFIAFRTIADTCPIEKMSKQGKWRRRKFGEEMTKQSME